MLKIRKVLLVLMLLSLTPSMLKPLNAKAQLATHSPFSSELEKRLADAARQYLIGEFDLTEVGYSLVVKEVALASASARVDLQLSFRTLELGEIVEIIHVFALHDGFEPVQIFREPSPEFYLYADRVSSDLLPQERLQLWQELREAENQNQFNKEDSFLNVSLYKLPWTGGQRYYVYQDGYKHFDFSLPQGTQVRAARGGQVYVKRASIDGGCCDASCDVYNNYSRFVHF